MPYLKLFHGRETPDEQLDDWGKPGPIFGPFPYFHTTYGAHITFDHDEGYLSIVGDLVYYDGLFYGDWSVFDGPPSEEDRGRHVPFSAEKAEVPEKHARCACTEPGHFNCGVPGVIAHLENSRLPPHAKVERCDQCGRYPDDESAYQKLVELGLTWIPSEDVHLYDVHCYATVRIQFEGIEASTPQDAARIADAKFDWDEHQALADFADEMNEYLVDVQGDADYSQSRRFNADFEEVDT